MDGSKCKTSFAPHSVVLNATIEQVYRSGEGNFNNSKRHFCLKKIPMIFCPSKGPAIFREFDFYCNSLRV